MNNKCPKCGCKEIVFLAVFRGDGRNSMGCAKCGYNWFFPPLEVTVFQQITQSAETLAAELVFRGHDKDGEWYTSHLLNEDYPTEAEAIAATVAKLKEVAK